VIAAVFALLAGPASAANAGFDEIKIANDAEAPLTIGVWYPTDARETKHRLGGLTSTMIARRGHSLASGP
jgi:hypothetical protein